MKGPDNIMAFDYGTRRIGVAVGHSKIGRGRGIGVIQVRNGQPDLAEMRKLVEQWQPGNFVLGMPGMNAESDSALKKDILQFGELLTQQFELPVSYVDETLSTEESNFQMSQADERIPKSRKTDARNKFSARIILETYFSELSR